MKSAKAWAEAWSGMTMASAEDVEFFLCLVQGNALRWAAKKADASGSKNDPWREAREHIASDIRAKAEELEGRK